MGEMLTLLSAADICFMGGSLIGDKVGGHNMLEPAALGVPVITGPSYFNFKQITEELLTEQAILVCEGATQLSNHLALLINDHNLRQSMQSAALAVVKRNQGSLSRTIKFIQG
jgi:3-deoxy-D-manno-octulosonic-acid transferase